MLVSKMTSISFICNLKIARDMGRKRGAYYTQSEAPYIFLMALNKGCVLYTGASYTRGKYGIYSHHIFVWGVGGGGGGGGRGGRGCTTCSNV